MISTRLLPVQLSCPIKDVVNRFPYITDRLWTTPVQCTVTPYFVHNHRSCPPTTFNAPVAFP
jgi:hypothetical protein